MAKPLARAATHGQADYRGNWLRPRPLARGQLDAARASPQGLSPIEAVARMGNQLQGARGGAARESGAGRKGDDTTRVREEG
ncbi:hypothetical protein GW17_00016112 [Ensete ventricosum]|nr:hypothetical protein GW17_00016112 [Ensete ventricosum]